MPSLGNILSLNITDILIIGAMQCINTRDNDKDLHKCHKQITSGSSCENFLNWKSCDLSCQLCACSTASGKTKEHCSGHGTCEATCSTKTCEDAKCKCQPGWTGDKCESGLF